jgi:glycosyltransferase involved in cell wall biosynthesis
MSPLRLSVALCSYNGSAYLPDQLASLARQARLPDELVAFDDASSDTSADVLRDFARTAPFPVRVHANPQNVGLSRNFHQAIAACSGDVIVLADQDDVWLPEKLGLIEAEFTKNPDLGFVFGDAEICDPACRPLGYRLWTSVGFTPDLRGRLTAGEAFEVILRQNIVTGATMAFSARFRRLVLPVDARWIHDGWIALLLSAVAPVAIIDRPLIHYRQHPQQSVGALRRTLFQQYQNARKMNRDVFARHAEMYQAAYDRLVEFKDEGGRMKDEQDESAASGSSFNLHPSALPRLEEKIRHYRTRSAIRLGQTSRLLPSLRELVSLRYRRYSLGWKSFAQDLFL